MGAAGQRAEGRGGGPTLEALAERVGEMAEMLGGLRRENERMRAENAELRGKVAALEGAGREERVVGGPGVAVEGRVSRRALLTKAGAAAVAAAGAGVLLSPREAKAAQVVGDGSPGVGGTLTSAGSPRAGVYGDVREGIEGYGVQGLGRGADFAGVIGDNNDGYGVQGSSIANSRAGVRGLGSDGVEGVSRKDGFSGVYGRHTDSTVGPGVTGVGRGAAGFGVVGKNFDAGGTGVLGEGTTGVRGTGTRTDGYGGLFQGGKAQLRIVPNAAAAGRPTTGNHAKGEIFMDRAANLWVCTATGTPGTWRRVTTTA